jgi:Mg2+/Co2+ transporter CorB
VNKDFRRILKIGAGTLVVSIFLGISSRLFLTQLSLFLGCLVLLLIITIGIIFDIVGTAVTAAQERPFHAMAAKRVNGAKQAISLVRNADKVANFCNDMVGDICGTISGAVGAAIVFSVVARNQKLSEPILSASVVALVSALTDAGKAAGKGFALEKSENVIFFVGQVLAWFEKNLKTLNTKFDVLTERVNTLSEDFNNMKIRQDEIYSIVSAIKHSNDEHKAEIDNLKYKVNKTDGTIEQIGDIINSRKAV